MLLLFLLSDCKFESLRVAKKTFKIMLQLHARACMHYEISGVTVHVGDKTVEIHIENKRLAVN